MPSERTLETKGARTVHVRSTGYEKERVTIMLVVTAGGMKLPPYVVLKRKTVPKITVPPGNVTDTMKMFKITQAIIPGGCTPLVQPLDVSVNRSFKAVVRHRYPTWFEEFGINLTTRAGNLQKPLIRLVLRWILEAWEAVPEELVVKAFVTCGISVAVDGSEDGLIMAHLRDNAEVEVLDDVNDAVEGETILNPFYIDNAETSGFDDPMNDGLEDSSGLQTEEGTATRPAAESTKTHGNQAASFDPNMMEKFFSFMSFYEQHQQAAPAQSNNSDNNNRATLMSLDGSSYARRNQQQPTFAPYEPQRRSISFAPQPHFSPGQEKTLDALQGIHLEADITTQEFKLFHGKGGLYIGRAFLKTNVFVLDFVPDQGTADSDAIVNFTSWTHPPDLDPDFKPGGFWYSHTIPEVERTRALAAIRHEETTSTAAETTSAAAATLKAPIDDTPPTPAQQLTPTPREVHRSANFTAGFYPNSDLYRRSPGHRASKSLWHERLGHPSNTTLNNTIKVAVLDKDSLILPDGRELQRVRGTYFMCPEADLPHQPFVLHYNPSVPTYAPLEKVYSDILYTRKQGQGAYNYVITFIDAATRYVWHLYLPSRDMAFEAFVAWLPVAERESGAKIKSFQTDGGGEYQSQRFRQYLAEQGIKRLISLPYAHQQQGVEERMNRTLQNTMRKLLRGMRLPSHQWPQAMDHAVMLHNLLSSSSLPNNASPHLLWDRKIGKHKNVRVLECMQDETSHAASVATEPSLQQQMKLTGMSRTWMELRKKPDLSRIAPSMNQKKLRQIDVANAFLYAPIDAEIFVELPHESNADPNQVCQFEKSLYGIKQAPRLWQQHLHARLIRIGFLQLPHDQGMYRLTKGTDYILLIVYVDDLLYIGSTDAITTWFEGELQWDLTLTVATTTKSSVRQQGHITDSLLSSYPSRHCIEPQQKKQIPDATEIPRWGDLLKSGVAIFDLDFDAILAAMYALSISAEGDCYVCVPPDPGIEAAALGARESAAPGASESAALGAGESALSDRTTLTPLSRPVAVSLADPSGGPVLARYSTVLRCPAAPSGSLSGLYLPSFSTNLVSGADLQDARVDQFTPASPESAPCSCCLLSHQTLLWHHRLGQPSLPRLRGMASHVLVSGLPQSLPPLPPGPAPTCVPCVEGQQRATPHSSEFPPTEAPLQTLHMDVWGPARVRGQGHERYFLLVVDDYSRYTTVFPLRSKGEVTEVLIDWIRVALLQLRERFGSDFPVLRLHSVRGGEFSSDLLRAFCRAEGIRQTFTLPASPQQNGIAERRTGMVMDVARTSMIHAAAPHFLWPFAVQYAAHQINLQPRVSLPETSPTLRWTGKVGDASAFRVWGSRDFVRDLSADKLSSCAVPCVFLGFPPDAPGWQFYHPTSRRVLSSQDLTFDESVPYYRLFPYRTAPLPPPPLFLAPGPSSVDPLPPQGPAPSVVSQVDAVKLVEVAVDSGASGGAEPERAEPGRAGYGGAEPEHAESGGAASAGAEPERAETRGAELGVAESGGAEPAGAGPGGPSGALSRRELPSPQELREWFARRWSHAARAGGAADAGGSAAAGGTGAGGVAGAGAGGSTSAGGAGATGPGGARIGGTGAAGPGGARGGGATGGAGAGAAVSAGGPAGAGAAGGTGAGGAAGVGADAGGAGIVLAGSGGASRPRPYFVSLLEQVLGLPPSSSPAPSLECPPPVQAESQLQLASPLPAPSPYAGPSGGLAERREPESRPASPVRTARTSCRVPRQRPPVVPGTHQMALRPSTAPQRVPLPSPPQSSLRAASPTVTRLLATAVTDPSFESADAGECALSTDVLEDRQEEFQCFAAALPHLVSLLLALEGDPDAPDIQTPRSYAEAIEGTYVDEVPPPAANIVSGMRIFRVKRPTGSPPVFKARYVARGFSQRQGVDCFQTFSPTPKMTTLRVVLHVTAQRDYELHSLDFSSAFLQGSLHEEIWLRRPPGFTGSFPPGTQWSLQRPVYGLRQAPREWHDTLRTTLAALGFAPSTADPLLFLRTDTSLPPFYILVYIDDLVFATADTSGLAHVKSELQKRHTCT
ncbi:unnamed protein product [Closterium sp. NIES-54]